MGAAPTAGSAGGAGAAGAAAKAGRKKMLLKVIAALAVVLIVSGVWITWKLMHPAPPVLTAPTPDLTKYVLSEKFVKAGFDTHVKYLDVMERRYNDNEVEKLWRAGKLTDAQISQLRDAAWMGKYVGRMNKYHSLPQGKERKEYIAKLVDKKTDPDDDADNKPKPVTDEAKIPKREKAWGKALVAAWPTDIQAQWKELHKEIKKEEERRDKEARKGPTTKAAATKTAG